MEAFFDEEHTFGHWMGDSENCFAKVHKAVRLCYGAQTRADAVNVLHPHALRLVHSLTACERANERGRYSEAIPSSQLLRLV